MTESFNMLRLNSHGVLTVGGADVPLDKIVQAHRQGHDDVAILARFPGMTAEELQAALDYHIAQGGEAPPRGPEQRDANWQKWNATLEEDLGTDTPPNEPIGRVG
jgi:uncharacterized protein (DUF433 family)